MRQFKWIEWNLQKIGAHALSAEDVEASFDHVTIFNPEKMVRIECSRRFHPGDEFG